MQLIGHEAKIRKVTSKDLAAYLGYHFPDMEMNGLDAVHDLFGYPSSDTVHLVRAQEGLNESDRAIVRGWLGVGTPIGSRTYADDVMSYLAADGAIPYGEYLITFN